MAEAIATTRGYFGGKIIEPGETFPVPDEVWNNPERRPKWAEPAGFGGKGDHDGDGKVGGSVPSAGNGDQFDAINAMTKAELVAFAKDRGIQVDGSAKKDDVLAAVKAGLAKPDAPFGDAPAPQTVQPQGNGLQEGLGGVQPDWLPPGGQTQQVD